MMKDVVISIRSLHGYGGEDEDAIDFTTDGLYTFDGETACLTYLESEVTGLEGTRTSVMVLPDKVVVDRDGGVMSRMIFREGEKNSFLYDTPVGSATLNMNTRGIHHRFDEHGVAPQWRYERVRIYVDDQGILAFYYDGSPYAVLERSSDAVRILPLEDAIDVFEKRIGIVYADSFDRVQIEDPSIRVTEIRLGLTRVLEQNAPNRAYLVPSWTFFGIEHLTSYNNMSGFEGFGFDGTTAVLTVNAIDGSVIDRNAGY